MLQCQVQCLGVLGHLQCEECECLQCFLEMRLINTSGRVGTSIVKVIILRCEDESREPEIREDPGDWGEVSLVRFESG
jgi:hypothetical protein